MNLLGEMITLQKKDGRSLAGIRALVQHDKVTFNETEPPLEEGDSIFREHLNGMRDEYTVLDVERRPYRIGDRGGAGGWHYQARVKKKSIVGP